ncbi:hypothetical protein ACEPAH_3812 [Sanghuangporus vaninii]
MIESIPAGRYAVATSSAKTYAYGTMTRISITLPPVTITDDRCLKASKLAPDPFFLAAKCLGFNAKRCIVFEESSSGIHSKIENCGAHFIVDDMHSMRCVPETGDDDGMKLRFKLDVAA